MDIEVLLKEIDKESFQYKGETYNVQKVGYNITSSTYIISGKQNKYVFKTKVSEEEICVYRNSSSLGFDLHLPKFEYIGSDCVMYEFVDYNTKISVNNYQKVLDWVISKNLYFIGRKIPNLKIRQSSYAIDLSLEAIKILSDQGRSDIVKRIENSKLTLQHLEELSKTQPLTLEHNDLHFQNILINPNEDDFKIIDWGEVRYGDGWIDIVYILREMRVLGMQVSEWDKLFVYCANALGGFNDSKSLFMAANLSRCIKDINYFCNIPKYKEIFDWQIFLLDKIIDF